MFTEDRTIVLASSAKTGLGCCLFHPLSKSSGSMSAEQMAMVAAAYSGSRRHRVRRRTGTAPAIAPATSIGAGPLSRSTAPDADVGAP